MIRKIFLELDHYYLHSDLFDTRAIMAQSSYRECIKIANGLLISKNWNCISKV